MSENRLRVTYFTPINSRETPNLLAGLGLCIISMDMYLPKVKLIKKKDGSVYVAPPSEEYVDNKTGKTEWANFWWFGQKTSVFFQTEALKAIKDWCSTKGIADPTISQPIQDLGASEPVHSMSDLPPHKGLAPISKEASIFDQ